jgi:hypothetical protein
MSSSSSDAWLRARKENAETRAGGTLIMHPTVWGVCAMVTI